MLAGMRYRVDLDEDVRRRLERRVREEGVSLRALVNRLLRRAIGAEPPTAATGREGTLPAAVSLGGCLLEDLDDIGGVLELLDVPDKA